MISGSIKINKKINFIITGLDPVIKINANVMMTSMLVNARMILLALDVIFSVLTVLTRIKKL